MKEKRVMLIVEVALDGVPGSMDNVGDFIHVIRRSIPHYYLRSVTVASDCYDEQRPDDEQNAQNYIDVADYAGQREDMR